MTLVLSTLFGNGYFHCYSSIHDDCALLNMYDGTAIICADIVEFTKKCTEMDPLAIIRVLNEVFSMFVVSL